MTNENPKRTIKSEESRAMIGSREEVTSTSAGERPTTPKNTKKTN